MAIETRVLFFTQRNVLMTGHPFRRGLQAHKESRIKHKTRERVWGRNRSHRGKRNFRYVYFTFGKYKRYLPSCSGLPRAVTHSNTNLNGLAPGQHKKRQQYNSRKIKTLSSKLGENNLGPHHPKKHTKGRPKFFIYSSSARVARK